MTEDKEDYEVLKEAYDKAKKKYNLSPNFEELDKEFEVSIIDGDRERFIVEYVRRAICSRIHKMINYLTPVLHPQPSSLHSMIESKFFKKEETDKLFEFYKKLHHWLHKGLLKSFQSEEEIAKFINEIWEIWPEIKDKVIIYMSKIVTGWEKQEKEDLDNGYLG
ncbi:hypothetical protein GF374_00050 [Candidatus Woesearchaeota archaeon]|nr:hypothetical protein [Candidatus Woesearchaeota archaeon]